MPAARPRSQSVREFSNRSKCATSTSGDGVRRWIILPPTSIGYRTRSREMETSSNVATDTSERELVIPRIFDAPRALVFKAWTDPEMQLQWMGPRGFTGKILTSAKGVGDAYRYYMRDPQGGDHWQQGVVREMREPERLVFTMAWANAEGQATRPETLV